MLFQGLSLDNRAEWFTVFRVWLAAKFRSEFNDAVWNYQVSEAYGLVTAHPRAETSPRPDSKVNWNLPTDFLARPPYVVAAQVAAEIRIQAEQMQLVPRRRIAGPSPSEVLQAAVDSASLPLTRSVPPNSV